MADDVILPGDGSTVATDEVGGKHYQRVKIELGAEGAAGTLLTVGQKTAANSLSVVLASDQGVVPFNLSQYGGSATTLGQKNMASSIPVVVASNQTQVNVAIEATPLVQTDTLTSFAYGLPALAFDFSQFAWGAIPLGNFGTTVQVELAGNSVTTGYMYGYRDDTATNLASEDNWQSVRITQYRALHANLRDASGNEFASATSTPAGSERGLITRNIPSGTQTVTESTSAAANVARGKIAAASLTNSYATVVAMGGNAKAIFLFNSTEQPVLFSLDGGTTDTFELDAGECVTIDYYALGLFATSANIQAKYVSTAPAVGSVRATVMR